MGIHDWLVIIRKTSWENGILKIILISVTTSCSGVDKICTIFLLKTSWEEYFFPFVFVMEPLVSTIIRFLHRTILAYRCKASSSFFR